jgi:aspartate/methionine/tyrosine aminotransferase
MYPNASHIIYDMVYFWPSSLPAKKIFRADKDIMVFSASKLTGHASSRFGWAYVRDSALAFKTISFYFSQTFGVSVDCIMRMVNVLGNVGKQEISDPNSFFHFAASKFEERWDTLSQLFAGKDAFSLESEPGTWFAWIRCHQATQNRTCLQIFEEGGIMGQLGNQELPDYVRLNLNVRETTWAFFSGYLEDILKTTK